MTPPALVLACFQTAAFLAVGWIVGLRLLRRSGMHERAGGPERTLFALVGGVAFSVALMVGNIVTGGAVFGIPFLVPAVALGILVTGRNAFTRPRLPWIPLVLVAGAVLTLYFGPVLAGGSGVRTGDSPWHLGWSEQLLAGDPLPSGPAPEFGRNAYPWGWHAVVATLVRLAPGSDSLIAYEALHLLLLLGIPLAGACLARRLDPEAGWAGAVAISLVGGFGWILAGGATFFSTPGAARLGADLVVASPNGVYGLFPPALPRELGVILLAAVGSLLADAVRLGGRSRFLTAGAVAGLTGLVSVPLFLSACVWFVAVAIARPAIRSATLPFFAAALVVFALWAGPVVGAYVRYGGFVDITPRLGREWPLGSALWSWGLLLPGAIAGLWMTWKRSFHPLLACWAGTLVLLGAAVARGAFDWELAGNATLLHQGRVWPAAHLLGAAFAAVAVTAIFRATRTHRAVIAGAVAPLLLGIAIASPALASLKMTRLISGQHDGFVYASADFAPGSFVEQAARWLGPDVTVEVDGSDRLAFALFQSSGVRLASFDDPRLQRNDLRIRYKDLARAWDARIAAGGFEADYVVEPGIPGDGRGLLSGVFEGEVWTLRSSSAAAGT